MFFNVRALASAYRCWALDPPRCLSSQILFNILIIAMLKYGSSNILWLCLTIQVPVQNLIWAIPGMPSGAPVTWEAGVGLFIIMGGLVVYRFWPLLRPRLRAALGMPPAEEDIAAAAKLAAAVLPPKLPCNVGVESLEIPLAAMLLLVPTLSTRLVIDKLVLVGAVVSSTYAWL